MAAPESTWKRTHTCGALRLEHVGEQVRRVREQEQPMVLRDPQDFAHRFVRLLHVDGDVRLELGESGEDRQQGQDRLAGGKAERHQGDRLAAMGAEVPRRRRGAGMAR